MTSLKEEFKTLLVDNQFIVPSYSHYQGLAGYQDYGILGCKVKNNFLAHWRKSFINNSDIDEIECPAIMPYEVLKASGHVDRFTDYVVSDSEGIFHRADHLVKAYFESNNLQDLANAVDSMTREDLQKHIIDYNILENCSPVGTLNLMFPIPNLSDESKPGYLRPELAQGIFVNFKACQQFNRKELPFGLSQVGKSYRNEIAPRRFSRMREFTQAEIEYFVDPQEKLHPRFDDIKHVKIPLLSSSRQLTAIYDPINISVEEALNMNMLSSQVMCYFLAKIFIFACDIGLTKSKLRFRQHLPNEMAHYALECWDLEVLVGSDWLECVGCADRADYDLKAHGTTNPIIMKRTLKQPIHKSELKITVDKKKFYKTYNSKLAIAGSVIIDHLQTLTQLELEDMLKRKISGDTDFHIQKYNIMLSTDLFDIAKVEVKIHQEDFVPHVIEPSFGVDRLIYAVLEHNFWSRKEDEQRHVLSFPSTIAPYKIAVLALHNKSDMIEFANRVKLSLENMGLECFTDTSAAKIGRKYSRLDEMGICKIITVDPGSLVDGMVTIRDRDTMNQQRVSIENLDTVIIG